MKAMASRIFWATWGLVAFGADSDVGVWSRVYSNIQLWLNTWYSNYPIIYYSKYLNNWGFGAPYPESVWVGVACAWCTSHWFRTSSILCRFAIWLFQEGRFLVLYQNIFFLFHPTISGSHEQLIDPLSTPIMATLSNDLPTEFRCRQIAGQIAMQSKP